MAKLLTDDGNVNDRFVAAMAIDEREALTVAHHKEYADRADVHGEAGKDLSSTTLSPLP